MRLGSGSTSSRSSNDTRRYRTRAPTSQVDETLFASPKPKGSLSDKRGNSDAKAKNRPEKKNEDGPTLQIITKDLIRNLRIPFRDPSGESVILPTAEFMRIATTSRILTPQEKEELRVAFHKKKEEEMKAVEERKRQIHEADLSRKENQALTELELEARDKAQRLVERANALRMEQEDEIKTLNQLILGAQCQATRDAQIHERREIETELLEEEKRLDHMMELDRRKAIETVEEIDEMRKQLRIRGKQQVVDQIQSHLEERRMEEETKEMEGQLLRQKQEKMNEEDIQALENKKLEQRRLQQEVVRINAQVMRAKEQRKEEERLADLRDMEYIKNKQEREAEYEAEQKQIKKDKELEIARLRAQQEKATDYKAQQDELRAKRNQEATDREWRKREKEMAEKKALEEEMLKAARLDQVHCKEHFLSVQAGREKAEFERVLNVQQETIIKQREKEEKQHRKMRQHAEAIRLQVRERELAAVATRRETYKEADRLVEEARQRRVRLQEIKENKLKKLKATGLSDKYCSEVERKARACAL